MAKITMQVEFSSVAEAAKFLAGAGQALPATIQVRSEPDDVAQQRESATSAAIMNAGPTSAPAAAPQQIAAASQSSTVVASSATAPTEQDVKTAANAYLAKQGGRTPETARAIFAKHGGAVNGVIKPGNIPEANRAACITEMNAS